MWEKGKKERCRSVQKCAEGEREGERREGERREEGGRKAEKEESSVLARNCKPSGTKV